MLWFHVTTVHYNFKTVCQDKSVCLSVCFLDNYLPCIECKSCNILQLNITSGRKIKQNKSYVFYFCNNVFIIITKYIIEHKIGYKRCCKEEAYK